MYKLLIFLILLSVLAKQCFAQPTKAETVKELALKECKLALNDQEALNFVRALYLTCIPESTVVVKKDCTLPCLRGNPGVIVGR